MSRFFKILFTFILFSTHLFSQGLPEMADSAKSAALPFEMVHLASTKTYPSINLTEIVLKNGMKICLKPTNFDPGEVSYKLSALGGYASLSEAEIPSGILAAQIAWESGLGKYTGDQVSVLLYENCLEFFPKIQPFGRSVEGSSPTEGIDSFLKCIQMLFTEQQFTKVGMDIAMTQARESFSKASLDHEQNYEAFFMETNTQRAKALCHLNDCDLKKVNFDVSKEFYKNCFSNPADFVCVIVGSFDVEEVKPLIYQRLGQIPSLSESKDLKHHLPVYFPKGVTKTTLPVTPRTEYTTRITLPLSQSLNEKNIHTFEFACQIIEARLRDVITKKMVISHGVDVAYEFPLYPHLENPWITIQFRSDHKSTPQITELVLSELKRLQHEGASLNEINEIKKLQNGSEDYWWSENCYWVSSLSNFYLWGWNPEKIRVQREETALLTVEEISEILKTYFDLTHYSIVSAKPLNG